MIMTHQAAGVRCTAVRDGCRAVGGDNLDIEVYKALAGNSARLRAHSVGRMASRAGEAILSYVAGVFAEAGVIHDLIEVVALGA